MSVENKVAVVTGATAGIGLSVVEALSEAGAIVVVTGRRLERCEAIVKELSASGHRALAMELDVSRPEQAASAIGQIHAELGRLDILINNAGVIDPIARLADIPVSDWDKSIAVNLNGPFFTLQAALPHLVEREGCIINLSSGAAHKALEGWSAYCCGKAGLAMLTAATHLEYGESGVRSFGLIPGVVDTGMQGKIRESGMNPVSQIPQGDLSSPKETAQAIVWLASGMGDDLSGQEIDIRDAEIRKRMGLKTA